MKPDLVSYVQRQRVTDWKRLVLTHAEPAFIYGSRDDDIFAKQLKDGGTLWVISSYPAGPPALVARLCVTAVLARTDPTLLDMGVSERLLRHFSEFKWIAVGGPGSEFFGHNNAGPALLNTTFEAPSGVPRRLAPGAVEWRGEYGSKLQRPTKVSALDLTGTMESGCTALRALAGLRERSVFISWKWRDNDPGHVRAFAHALVENGFMPWLDQLALPRARALKIVEKDQEKLEKLLAYGYEHSFAVIAIQSDHYGLLSPRSDKNWTLREWNGELAPGKHLLKVVYNPHGAARRRLLQAADAWLASRDPQQAAAEFKDRVDTHPQPSI